MLSDHSDPIVTAEEVDVFVQDIPPANRFTVSELTSALLEKIDVLMSAPLSEVDKIEKIDSDFVNKVRDAFVTNAVGRNPENATQEASEARAAFRRRVHVSHSVSRTVLSFRQIRDLMLEEEISERAAYVANMRYLVNNLLTDLQFKDSNAQLPESLSPDQFNALYLT